MEESWPEDYAFPEDLEEPLTQRHLDDLFEYEWRVMLRSDLSIGDDVRSKLESKVITRSDADADARLQHLRTVVDGLTIPRRYRRGAHRLA